MAGMDWFRWHHGSVTDPKFALVARKAEASVPDVLAVWAYILEAASQSVERGDFGTVDCEALDCVFGFPAPETRTADILAALSDRGLTDGTRIAAWEKRQVRREREDTTNADRQATFKAKQNQVTPDNARDNQKTPRVEESRVDKSREDKEERAKALVRPDDVDQQVWIDWVQLRKAKKAPVTATVLKTARKEAALARMTLTAFLEVWCARGSQGLEAAWLHSSDKPSQFAKPAPSITVPSRTGRDPELIKREFDDQKRAAPSLETLAAIAKIKLGKVGYE